MVSSLKRSHANSHDRRAFAAFDSSASFRYDVANNVWLRGPDLPTVRGAGGLAIYKDVNREELHFFGGGEILPQHKIADYTTHWSLDLTAP